MDLNPELPGPATPSTCQAAQGLDPRGFADSMGREDDATEYHGWFVTYAYSRVLTTNPL